MKEKIYYQIPNEITSPETSSILMKMSIKQAEQNTITLT